MFQQMRKAFSYFKYWTSQKTSLKERVCIILNSANLKQPPHCADEQGQLWSKEERRLLLSLHSELGAAPPRRHPGTPDVLVTRPPLGGCACSQAGASQCGLIGCGGASLAWLRPPSKSQLPGGPGSQRGFLY